MAKGDSALFESEARFDALPRSFDTFRLDMKKASEEFLRPGGQRAGTRMALHAVRLFLFRSGFSIPSGEIPLRALEEQLADLDFGAIGEIVEPKRSAGRRRATSLSWSIRTHLAAAVDFRIRLGDGKDEAARRVSRDFGSVGHLKEKRQGACGGATDVKWLLEQRRAAHSSKGLGPAKGTHRLEWMLYQQHAVQRPDDDVWLSDEEFRRDLEDSYVSAISSAKTCSLRVRSGD